MRDQQDEIDRLRAENMQLRAAIHQTLSLLESSTPIVLSPSQMLDLYRLAFNDLKKAVR